MRKKNRKPYIVAAVYDTETTTIGEGADAYAFAYAYIWNDLTALSSLKDYVPDVSDEITIERTAEALLSRIDELVNRARADAMPWVPVVCAYNLMFDMQTIIAALGAKYDMRCIAQTSTHVYALDLHDRNTGEPLLRFWDTFFLDMSGLKSMGRTAGLPKATGDLDYSLTRHHLTPLTDREVFYMRRDVQVIPAYLRWLLEANDWMEERDFGFKILTKTGIARQMALHTLYDVKAPGSKWNIGMHFDTLCKRELPPDFDTMALRVAAFRGGLTITAARTASTLQRRVGSWDVTSMHHQYLNGRRVPVKWHPASPRQLEIAARSVFNTSREDVLAHYEDPFPVNVCGMYEFGNLRLRRGTAFEYYGIALLAEGKFVNKQYVAEDSNLSDHPGNEGNIEVDNAVKARGFVDRASGATFAFGKLYRADWAQVCLTEVELWNMSRVYEWDWFRAVAGEITASTELPPDYVSIQSNLLFDQKTDVKHIMNTYEPGVPYPEKIPATIPDSIAAMLYAGEVSATFMKSYYTVNTKGTFNSLYGIEAMQLWRPDFMVEDNGEIHVDSSTTPTPENFDEKTPEHPRVLYTYGTRIVAGSRQHLVIAIELIYEAFQGRAMITGGDTDSLKIALPDDVTPDDVTAAFEPLHAACRAAKSKAQSRIRKNFPQYASELDKIGEFDFEPASKTSDLYEQHMEFWNKARVSFVEEHTHITFAGISRPERPEGFEGVAYNIEELMDALIASGYSFERVASACCGYNASLAPSVAHTLMRSRPLTTERVCALIVDYLGHTAGVDVPAAQALYPIWKTVGESDKPSNGANIHYLRSRYNREVDTRDRYIETTGDNATPRVRIGNTDDEILEIS